MRWTTDRILVFIPSSLHNLQLSKTTENVEHLMHVPFKVSAFGILWFLEYLIIMKKLPR
jgi:hypothetical protein